MPQPPSTKALGSPFLELQSVDSTNNYARRLIKEACLPDRQGFALHGTAIFAHKQVAGKGQRSKVWSSEKEANIILSLVVNPQPLQLIQQFQLSACVALAVQEFFMKYAGNETKIKWPNDLYWQDRKAGGILIESGIGSLSTRHTGGESAGGIWEWAIIGIGININQTDFPADLPNPVSLKQITGKTFDTVALAKELCAVLNEKFTELINQGFENIYARYVHHLYKRNATIKLKKNNRMFEAVLKTISPSGKLMVQHSIEEDPIAIGFDFNDVEWVIK